MWLRALEKEEADLWLSLFFVLSHALHCYLTVTLLILLVGMSVVQYLFKDNFYEKNRNKNKQKIIQFEIVLPVCKQVFKT